MDLVDLVIDGPAERVVDMVNMVIVDNDYNLIVKLHYIHIQLAIRPSCIHGEVVVYIADSETEVEVDRYRYHCHYHYHFAYEVIDEQNVEVDYSCPASAQSDDREIGIDNNQVDSSGAQVVERIDYSQEEQGTGILTNRPIQKVKVKVDWTVIDTDQENGLESNVVVGTGGMKMQMIQSRVGSW